MRACRITSAPSTADPGLTQMHQTRSGLFSIAANAANRSYPKCRAGTSAMHNQSCEAALEIEHRSLSRDSSDSRFRARRTWPIVGRHPKPSSGCSPLDPAVTCRSTQTLERTPTRTRDTSVHRSAGTLSDRALRPACCRAKAAWGATRNPDAATRCSPERAASGRVSGEVERAA